MKKTKTKKQNLALLFSLLFLSVFFVKVDKMINVAKADAFEDCKAINECSTFNGQDAANCLDMCQQAAAASGDTSSGAVTSDAQMQAFCSDNGLGYDSSSKQCIEIVGPQAPTTYAECKASGGSEASCARFPGAPQTAANIANATSGDGSTCTHNSDCGTGFTCYQGSCIDDATYAENVAWYNRAGNATSQVFTPGGSVISSNGTASNSTVATTTQPATINGTTVPANSRVMSNGSIVDSNYNVILPAGSVPQTNLSSGSNLIMCANGILSAECRDGNGNYIGGTPLVMNSAGLGGLPGGYTPNGGKVAGLNGVQAPKCGANFQEIGGVCFPTNTGLSSAPISLILTNLFYWLMGMFTTFAVGAFVFAGLQYLTSAGDAAQAEKGKKNASFAAIGIVIGLSGFLIIKAIAAALSGQSYFF